MPIITSARRPKHRPSVSSLEVSEEAYHRWQNQCGGMKAREAKRFKKMVAELMLDKKMLKDLAEGNF